MYFTIETIVKILLILLVLVGLIFLLNMISGGSLNILDKIMGLGK